MERLPIYDVIVCGVGSMGSAACYNLAKRGAKVLGLEQFGLSHELGSHGGQSRLIRKAYFEHPGYVPLLKRAYENWREIEAISGEQVYFETGILYAGPPNHVVMRGVKESAEKYNIPLEKTYAAIRFPQFKIPAHFETLFEPEAGFLLPGKCIELFAEKARELGAKILEQTKLVEWHKNGGVFEVLTNKGKFRAKKLLLSGGAWIPSMLQGFEKFFTVTRQTLGWLIPKDLQAFRLENFPCWIIADDQIPGVLYGFPALDTNRFGEPGGIKLAHHHAAQITDPVDVNRKISRIDEAQIQEIFYRYFHGDIISSPLIKTCLYTNTPDEHFVIDYLPSDNDIIVAAGFSGHGFKFASAIGEMLADLALDRQPGDLINFLGFDRLMKKQQV